MGPNTALGHNSVILMIEAQIEFVLRALDHRRHHGIDVLEIGHRAQREYNAWLHDKLAGTVWNSGGCSSWYLHPESGRRQGGHAQNRLIVVVARIRVTAVGSYVPGQLLIPAKAASQSERGVEFHHFANIDGLQTRLFQRTASRRR